MAAIEKEEPEEKTKTANMCIEKFPPQPKNSDHIVNNAIERSYLELCEERNKFFEEVRQKLRNDAALRELVGKRMKQLGYAELLTFIS
jgi:hypothetical protein